jgi:hypothetical protein
MGNVSLKPRIHTMNSPIFLLTLIAITAILSGGCSPDSPNGSAPPNFGREFDYDMSFPHTATAVELSDHAIRVSGEPLPASETDLAEALSVTLWKFKVTVPSNTDTLGVSIDLVRSGQPVKHLNGLDLDIYQLKDVGKNGGEVPIVVAISPSGNAQDAGIFDSPKLRIFLKSPYESGPRIVPNPFYHTTNGVATYGISSGVTSHLMQASSRDGHLTNQLDIHFRAFGYPDTNNAAAAAANN